MKSALLVLFCFPGGPGSTQDAQPVVDQFLDKLAPLAGWSAVSGTYYNDMTQCRDQFTRAKPDVVIVPLDIFLARRATWKLSAVSALQNRETSSRYHLVARKGATLASLKGQKLLTGLKAAAKFFSRVGFGGRVDLERDFDFGRTRSPLRAVKNVAKGKAAAALLDDVQQRSLDGLPMARDLVTVLSGPELPGAIVAGVGLAPPRLGAALATVCKQEREACKEMRITGFAPVNAKRLLELEQQLSQ